MRTRNLVEKSTCIKSINFHNREVNLKNFNNLSTEDLIVGRHLLTNHQSSCSLKAAELIKHLAEANRYHIDSTTSEDTIKLYQLLRAMPYEGLDILWKQFAGNEEQR